MSVSLHLAPHESSFACRGGAGAIGMKLGKSVKGQAGEERLIAAYRTIDTV